MENEVISEDSVNLESFEAFDDYYYKDILNSLNDIKNNQNIITNSIIETTEESQHIVGVLQYHTTFLEAIVFLISLFIVVTSIRNMIKKQ